MSEMIPLSLQTTYRDLIDRHARRPSPEIEGSVLRVTNKGGNYWVARRRIGDAVVERRIGPDDETGRARADILKRQNEDLARWARDTGALVAQLRAARMPTPTIGTGKLINALARVGLFDGGGVLAGTHAFGLYALELGVRLRDSLAMTEDVDVVAAREVRIVTDEATSLAGSLDSLGLRPVAGPGDPHPVRWETGDGVILDILTPRRRGADAIVRHGGLGVWAQALPYLEFSLVDPIDAVALYREGVRVRIPSPERYAIHKLIVAAARTGTYRAKVEKDLAQAAALIEVLVEARPYELAVALADARARGPKWGKAISASLSLRPDVSMLLERL